MDISLTISKSDWATATAYTVNQYVTNDARDYYCTVGHTSAAGTEPGTGASWSSYWSPTHATRRLQLMKDGQSSMWQSYEVSQDQGNQDKPFWLQTDWSGGMGQGVFSAPNAYALGSGIDTTHYGQFFLGPNIEAASSQAAFSSYPCAYAYFNSTIYMLTADYKLWKWNSTLSRWDTVGTTLGATTMCVHGDYLYLPSETTGYQYCSTGDALTTVTGYYAGGFVSSPPYAGNTPILWRYRNITGDSMVISQTDDPTDGSTWADAIEVGDTSASIRNMFIHQGQLYIGKTDGLYHYDSDGVVHKLLDLKNGMWSEQHNFRWLTTLKGSTYFNIGNQIGELTTYNSFDMISPFLNVTDLDAEDLICVGVTADEEHLYALYMDSTYLKVYKGTLLVDPEGATKWVWCLLGVEAVSSSYPGCYVGPSIGGVHPRLWWGHKTGTTYTSHYIKLAKNPVATTFYYSDSPSFTTTGYLETGWIDCGYRDWFKILDSILVEITGTMGTVAVAYEADESGSYTTIGTYSSTTSGTKDYIPTAPKEFKKIRFKITLTGATTASTPIVKYICAYGAMRPNRVQLFDFTVSAETGSAASAKSLRDFLLHCRDSRGLHTLTDRYGASHYVRILPGYPRETEYIDEATKQPAMAVRVICEKVDWS